MQTPTIKRSLLTLFEADQHDPLATLYREPTKKIKKLLTIEIPDTIDGLPNKIAFNHRPRSAEVVQTPDSANSRRSSTSTPPRFARGGEKRSALDVKVDEYESDFDDYSYNDIYFSITTKKCNRRTMEDRVYFSEVIDLCR
jgi:hypothetical protein